MKTIRQFDDFRWRVITPTDWGHDVSEPMSLNEALTESVGNFPIVLSPPPKKGESKQVELLHKRTIKRLKTPCDVVGCSKYARFAGVSELSPFTNGFGVFKHWHNLCPSCLVVFVQELKQCE